jgi:hypothetical protein
MKVRARWATWAMALLGAYLFFAPDISAIDEAPSMRNSRMVGVCIVGIIVWGLGIKSRVTEWTKAALGCWLLLAPFALGYGGMAVWNARAVGVLILALVGVRSDPSALWAWLRTGTLHLRARRITPNGIVGYRGSEVPPIPGVLSRQIVERSDQVYRTLLREPSEAEVEMCALGCSACMDDLITLNLLVNEEVRGSGPVRRLRLKAARRQATGSLSRSREALSADALPLSIQKQPQK